MNNTILPIAGVIVGILLGYLFFSSSSEMDTSAFYESRLIKCEELIQNREKMLESAAHELSQIHTNLDRITEDTILSFDLAIKDDAIAKLDMLDSLRRVSERRVMDLQNRLASNRSSGDTKALNAIISNLRNQLRKKDELIKNYRVTVDSLAIENVKLEQAARDFEVELHTVKEQKDSVSEKNRVLEREHHGLLEENEELSQELDMIQESLMKEKADLYYRLAEDLMQEYFQLKMKTLRIGQKSTRKQIIRSAYEYYRKSCQLGHSEASKRIRKLLNSKDFQKDLEVERSNVLIGKCGV